MGFILSFVELYFFNRIEVEAQQRGESTKETREESGKEQGEDPSLIKNRPPAIRDVITVSYVRKIARLAFFFSLVKFFSSFHFLEQRKSSQMNVAGTFVATYHNFF
jgi:hypothetical protein